MKIIKSSDVERCPLSSLAPSHYRVNAETGEVDCACGWTCSWFALCDREATGFMPHPILGDVAICDRCRARAEEPVSGPILPPKRKCDECLRRGKSTPAVYDAKTVHGPWGYLCEEDFKLIGIGLGTGLGQRLVKGSE